jgi:hypothetical protein
VGGGLPQEEVGEVEEAPEDQGGRAQLLRDVGDEGLPVLVELETDLQLLAKRALSSGHLLKQ